MTIFFKKDIEGEINKAIKIIGDAGWKPSKYNYLLIKENEAKFYKDNLSLIIKVYAYSQEQYRLSVNLTHLTIHTNELDQY